MKSRIIINTLLITYIYIYNIYYILEKTNLGYLLGFRHSNCDKIRLKSYVVTSTPLRDWRLSGRHNQVAIKNIYMCVYKAESTSSNLESYIIVKRLRVHFVELNLESIIGASHYVNNRIITLWSKHFDDTSFESQLSIKS